jgi:hypothetical protein
MATALTDIDKISYGMEKMKFSKDDSETQITVCTWNINGSARAGLRKRVTIDTFNLQQYQDGTRLGQSDLICIQEMTTMPGTPTTLEYFPFARDYGVVGSKELTGNIYNAVYFNQEKFSQVADWCLTRAYTLMAIKKRCYDYIQQGGNDRKMAAIKGQLNYPWVQNPSADERLIFDDDKKRIFQEVLSECKEAGTLQGFDTKMSKFRAPGELETKDPSFLLNRRMTMCVLKIKSIREMHNNNIIVAASVHNYSRRSGRGAPENYASLLFDFLSKLPRDFTVIIAGDFNFDIRCLALPQSYYHNPSYDLRPLRWRKGTIDFIVVSKTKPDAELQVSVTEVQAHDLQVAWEVDYETKGDHSKITNHSPVSAVIKLKLNVFDVYLAFVFVLGMILLKGCSAH